MTLDDLRTEIRKMRQIDKKSYGFIAKVFDISKPTARRIAMGEKISQFIQDRLKLDPPKKLQHTRDRRAILNKIAQYWKYKNWSDYETQVIKDFDENFDWETGSWESN